MYHQTISQCVQHLRNLEVWLDQAERYAAAKGFDVNVLMSSRLAPDMMDFGYQVRTACDYVEAGAATLTGQAPPTHKTFSSTVNDVRQRLHAAIAFSESIEERRYADASDQKVRISWARGRAVNGKNYLIQVTVPNVFFHVVTAYAILRHNGVDIGKMDFLGPIEFENLDMETRGANSE